MKSNESYLNILGWLLLSWQLPLIWLKIRMPFKLRYAISGMRIWFCNWHKKKHWLYPKEIRENLKDPWGLGRQLRDVLRNER